MKTIKIVGIVILILLLITLIIVAGVLIYKMTHKKSEPTTPPTPTPTSISISTDSRLLTKKQKIPANRNTIYEIKGKFVRYDPDLYDGEIARNSSQHPNYVKLVQSYGNRRRRQMEDN